MSILDIVAGSTFVALFVLSLWKGKTFLKTPIWVRLSVILPIVIIMFLWIWHLNERAETAEPVWDDLQIEWKKDQLPLQVWFEKGIDTPETLAVWNRAVPAGCVLFQKTIDRGAANVIVVVGDYGGDCAGKAWKTPLGAKIEVNDPGMVGQTYLIIAHELGHILGLAHDPRKNSIMLNGVQAHAGTFPTPKVTAKDQSALSERYCN